MKETIYDHNITDKEMAKMWCRSFPKEENLKTFEKHHDSRVGAISRLYAIRGDMEKAYEYAEMLEDKDAAIDLLTMYDGLITY